MTGREAALIRAASPGETSRDPRRDIPPLETDTGPGGARVESSRGRPRRGFLLRPRFFILPAAGVVALFFAYWAPLAQSAGIFCIVLALGLAAVEYFLMPDAHRCTVTRMLPREFFHFREEVIGLTVSVESAVPLTITLQDRPPDNFRDDDPVFTFTLSRAAGERSCSYAVVPRRRGEARFGAAGVRITTRIGMIARQFTVACERTILVYPRFPRHPGAFISRYCTSASPNRTVRAYGPGSEFHQMREYKPGDDIRAVHWKRSARLGTPVVREFEPEKGQTILLMVDGGRLMLAEYHQMTKVDWALSACVALADEALRRRDAVGLLCFSNVIELYVAPSNKERRLSALIETASRFQPRFLEPDYGSVFRWVYATLNNRSIVLIFTDFFDSYLSRELCAHIMLLRRKHRVICCVLEHPEMERLGYAPAASVRDAVTAAVIRESLDNRDSLLRGLRRSGVDIVDTSPGELGGAVLSAYVKARWK